VSWLTNDSARLRERLRALLESCSGAFWPVFGSVFEPAACVPPASLSASAAGQTRPAGRPEGKHRRCPRRRRRRRRRHHLHRQRHSRTPGQALPPRCPPRPASACQGTGATRHRNPVQRSWRPRRPHPARARGAAVTGALPPRNRRRRSLGGTAVRDSAAPSSRRYRRRRRRRRRRCCCSGEVPAHAPAARFPSLPGSRGRLGRRGAQRCARRQSCRPEEARRRRPPPRRRLPVGRSCVLCTRRCRRRGPG
jgi:hypothetical protein